MVIDEIDRAINEIKAVTDAFYKQDTAAGYRSLERGLGAIDNAVNAIFEYKKQNNKAEIDTDIITATLKNAMEAIEKKDSILLSDILNYELTEQLEEIRTAIIA